MDWDLEGFSRVSLHLDPDNLPSFSFALNKGTLLGNRFVTVHVKIDLFSRWISVVPKHDLLGDSHASPPGLRHRPELSVQRRRFTSRERRAAQFMCFPRRECWQVAARVFRCSVRRSEDCVDLLHLRLKAELQHDSGFRFCGRISPPLQSIKRGIHQQRMPADHLSFFDLAVGANDGLDFDHAG